MVLLSIMFLGCKILNVHNRLPRNRKTISADIVKATQARQIYHPNDNEYFLKDNLYLMPLTSFVNIKHVRILFLPVTVPYKNKQNIMIFFFLMVITRNSRDEMILTLLLMCSMNYLLGFYVLRMHFFKLLGSFSEIGAMCCKGPL